MVEVVLLGDLQMFEEREEGYGLRLTVECFREIRKSRPASLLF